QCLEYQGAVKFNLGLSEQNRSDFKYRLFKQSRSNLERDHDISVKELTDAIEFFKSSPLLLETKFLISEAYHYRGLLYKAKGDSQMANSDFKEHQNLIRIT
ncbi:41610_t:CDS:2, partial [Gigaspora margarita]